MSELFEAVTQGVAAVSHASREVAIGNAGLSGRTGSIRGSIEDVSQKAQSFSNAMDDCGYEVQQAAEHARAMRADAQRSRKAISGLRDRMHAADPQQRDPPGGRPGSSRWPTRPASLNASIEVRGPAAPARASPWWPRRFGCSPSAARMRPTGSNRSCARRQDIEEGGLMTDRAVEAVRQTDEKVDAVNRIMDEIVRLTRDSLLESQDGALQPRRRGSGTRQCASGRSALRRVGRTARSGRHLEAFGTALRFRLIRESIWRWQSMFKRGAPPKCRPTAG
jgi:hypothetical protein